MPKRAAVYTRVSTGAQEQDGSSLETQEVRCLEYLKGRGYEPVGVFREVHSGFNLDERPQLNKLRDAVRTGQVDVVVCHAVDRLARNQAHIYIVLEEFQKAGISLEFVTEIFEDTTVGKFILSAKTFAAEIEREKIRERSLRGKKARLESGKIYSHSGELYGYRRDKNLGIRTVYEPEARIVQQIFTWVGEEGVSIRGLIRRLNAENIPAPAEGKRNLDTTPRWAKGTIARILTNEAYLGITYAWRYKRPSAYKPSALRPKEEWLRLPAGITPPILGQALFDTVQKRLKENKGDETRNLERPVLLRGLIRCRVCGRPMRTELERELSTFRCSSREHPSGPCGAKRVRADLVTDFVWERVAEVIKDPSIILYELHRRQEAAPSHPLEADRQTAQTSLQRVEKKQARLIRLYAEGESLDLDAVKRELALVDRERKRLQATLEALDEQIANRRVQGESLEELYQYCDEVAGQVDNFDFAQKRRALEKLGLTIRASGRDWSIRFSVAGMESEPWEIEATG